MPEEGSFLVIGTSARHHSAVPRPQGSAVSTPLHSALLRSALFFLRSLARGARRLSAYENYSGNDGQKGELAGKAANDKEALAMVKAETGGSRGEVDQLRDDAKKLRAVQRPGGAAAAAAAATVAPFPNLDASPPASSAPAPEPDNKPAASQPGEKF